MGGMGEVYWLWPLKIVGGIGDTQGEQFRRWRAS
jgi:hypothetical protein